MTINNQIHSDDRPDKDGQDSSGRRDVFDKLILLVLIIVFVSRSCLTGNDLDLFSSFLIYHQMVLLLLVLFWALRLFYPLRPIIFGWIDAGLLGLLCLMVVGSLHVAPFKKPAWFCCWEVLSGWILFFITRQIVIDPFSHHLLGCVILSTGITSLTTGLFDLGSGKSEFLDSAYSITQPMGSSSVLLETSPGFFPQRLLNWELETVQTRGVLLAFFCLCLPGLIQVQFLAWKQKHRWWVRFVLLLALVLTVMAFLRICKLLPVLVVASAFIVLLFWMRNRLVGEARSPGNFGKIVRISTWVGFMGIVLVLASTALNFDFLIKDLIEKLRYWQINWFLIQEHPFLGLGPGNFEGQFSPFAGKYGLEPRSHPGNFLLETINFTGLLGGVLLLLILTWFYFIVWQDRSSFDLRKVEAREPPNLPWEIYLAGMLGLVLGFFFKLTSQKSGGNLAGEGIEAMIRCGVWFLSLGALQGIDWPSSDRLVSWSCGVTLCLAGMFVESGTGMVSPVLLMGMGLAMECSRKSSAPEGLLPKSLVFLATPLFFAFALLFLVGVLWPNLLAQFRIRQAIQSANSFQADQMLQFHQRQLNTLSSRKNYLQKNVVVPLLEASQMDPGNLKIQFLLAWTRMKLYFIDSDPETARLSISHALNAQEIDPTGTIPLILESELRKNFARPLVPPQIPGVISGLVYETWIDQINREKPMIAGQIQKGKQELLRSAEALERAMNLDPTNAQLAYQQAELFAGIPDRNLLKTACLHLQQIHSNNRGMREKLHTIQTDQINYWLQD